MMLASSLATEGFSATDNMFILQLLFDKCSSEMDHHDTTMLQAQVLRCWSEVTLKRAETQQQNYVQKFRISNFSHFLLRKTKKKTNSPHPLRQTSHIFGVTIFLRILNLAFVSFYKMYT